MSGTSPDWVFVHYNNKNNKLSPFSLIIKISLAIPRKDLLVLFIDQDRFGSPLFGWSQWWLISLRFKTQSVWSLGDNTRKHHSELNLDISFKNSVKTLYLRPS